MNYTEILGFLIPNLHTQDQHHIDWIQISFFSIILLLLVGTVVFLCRDTGPSCWQALWNAARSDDLGTDADISNGSLEDLQNIVRTKGEKLADAMPGIVLVVGLLGTFLGLGIALNKASQILATAKAGGMDHAMADLMGMMEGLGVKFKTSTWGIIAFLILRVVSGVTGYNTKRTKWCAAKIQTYETMQRKTLLEERKQLNGSLDQIRDQGATQLNFSQRVQDHNQALLEVIEKSAGQLGELLEERKQLNEILGQIRDQGATQLDFSQRVQDHNEALLGAIEKNTGQLSAFVEHSQETLDNFNQATDKMAAAAVTSSKAAADLQNGVKTFGETVTEILTSVKDDLNQTILQIGTDLKDSTGELSTATRNFSAEMLDVLADMKNTLNKSIEEMGNNFTQLTQNIGTEMKEGSQKIAGAVDGMSDNARAMMEGFDERAQKTQGSILKVINEFTKISRELRDDMKHADENSRNTIGTITIGLKAISDFQLKLDDALNAITKGKAS